MGNRINLRTIPGIEPGLYGQGSVDIKHLKLDFLEQGTIPSYSQILNLQQFKFGNQFYDMDYNYRVFKDVLVNNQRSHIWDTFERKDRRAVNSYYEAAFVDGRGHGYGNFYLEKKSFGALKPDADTSWINRFSGGYPFFTDVKKTYTARIGSLETWCNTYFGDNERQYANSKVHKKYVQRTESFPTIDVKFNLYDDVNSVYKFNPYYINSLSDGNIILYGDASSISADSTDILNDPTLTPGFYKLNPETGNIDTTFFVKNSSGSRGVINIDNGGMYGMFIANDCIFLNAHHNSTITFDDESQVSSKIFKISADGTIDTTFFPENLSNTGYAELRDIQYVNGYYYLCFWNFYGDYGTLLQGDYTHEIIRVDEDGSNPISVLSAQRVFTNSYVLPGGYTLDQTQDFDIQGLAGKPVIFDDGTIIAWCGCSFNDFQLFKILPTGELDLSFTFNEYDHPIILNKKVYGAKFRIIRNNGWGTFNLTKLNSDSFLINGYDEGTRLETINYTSEGYENPVLGTTEIKIGKLLKVLNDGSIDYTFNALGSFSDFGKRYVDSYEIGLTYYANIQDVKVIDEKIYLVIVSSETGMSTYRGSNETIIHDEPNNLIRLNLDGSVDVEFSKLQFFGDYSKIFKKNGKLFVYCRPKYDQETGSIKSYIGLNEMFDQLYERQSWSKYPSIGKRFIKLDPKSYIQGINGEWTVDNENYINTITSGNLFEIKENVINEVNYFSSMYGENAYSYSDFCPGNSYFQNLEYTLSETGFGNPYDEGVGSQQWGNNETDVWFSTGNTYQYIFTKYYNGFGLTPEEERSMEAFHSVMVEYLSSSKWNKDMFNQEWFLADENSGWEGYNPIFSYIDYISLNATKDMSMAEIFGASDFNILSSVTMPMANIDKLVDGNPGDVFWSHDANTYYMWNSRTTKWEPFLGNMIGDMIIPEIKSRLNEKIQGFKELYMQNTAYTWGLYHITKANLDDYLERQ